LCAWLCTGGGGEDGTFPASPVSKTGRFNTSPLVSDCSFFPFFLCDFFFLLSFVFFLSSLEVVVGIEVGGSTLVTAVAGSSLYKRRASTLSLSVTGVVSSVLNLGSLLRTYCLKINKNNQSFLSTYVVTTKGNEKDL
jgi:hypothetical protein